MTNTLKNKNFIYKGIFLGFGERKERRKKSKKGNILSRIENMAKLKTLMPSLKEKKRFVVFEIISKREVKDFKLICRAVLEKSNEFLGKLETAKAGIWLLEDKWDSKKQKGLLKVNNKYIDKLRAIFTMIQEIAKQKVIIRSIGVSGILKKAEQKFMI